MRDTGRIAPVVSVFNRGNSFRGG
ncbi:hypothetical protein RHCRD62_30055 [Rhodococcus sp. RD6.2]|nr:hypothetical protein RHCRD62_30055 [Rhodococcus sp. RD6.2]